MLAIPSLRRGEAPRLDGETAAHVTGRYGVDAHIFFYVKPPGPLTSLEHSHTGQSYGKWDQTQWRVQAASEKAAEYGFVLYPTKKGQPPPKVSVEKSGVLRVETPDEEDLVFLFPEETEAVCGPLRFKGRCGVAKKINGQWSLIPLSGSLVFVPPMP